jgi:hypothetical protein
MKVSKMKVNDIFRRILVGLILISCMPLVVHSQPSESNSFYYESKISLTFYLATTFGGPQTAIEKQMRISGFDVASYGLFSRERITHPHSRYNGLPWMIDANYRFTPLLSGSIQMSNSLLRETIGYANPQGGIGEHLFLNYSVKSYATVISFYLEDYFIVGFGPTYNTVISYQDYHGQQTDTIEETKIGLMAQVILKLQLGRVFSLNLIGQYRFIGSSTIGPFVREKTIGWAAPNPTTYTITFPETKISYNHGFVGLGLGMHF